MNRERERMSVLEGKTKPAINHGILFIIATLFLSLSLDFASGQGLATEKNMANLTSEMGDFGFDSVDGKYSSVISNIRLYASGQVLLWQCRYQSSFTLYSIDNNSPPL